VPRSQKSQEARAWHWLSRIELHILWEHQGENLIGSPSRRRPKIRTKLRRKACVGKPGDETQARLHRAWDKNLPADRDMDGDHLGGDLARVAATGKLLGEPLWHCLGGRQGAERGSHFLAMRHVVGHVVCSEACEGLGPWIASCFGGS